MMEILNEFRADMRACTSSKQHPKGVTEVITPFSTLSDNFVSVFVEPTAEGWRVTDGGYLAEQAYADDDLRAYSRAIDFVEDEETAIRQDKEVFYQQVTDPAQLTSVMFDMAQFVQLMVNLSYLAQDER
ncbi:hypothetical protein [Hymenobacter tenuis]